MRSLAAVSSLPAAVSPGLTDPPLLPHPLQSFMRGSLTWGFPVSSGIGSVGAKGSFFFLHRNIFLFEIFSSVSEAVKIYPCVTEVLLFGWSS